MFCTTCKKPKTTFQDRMYPIVNPQVYCSCPCKPTCLKCSEEPLTNEPYCERCYFKVNYNVS